MREIQPADSRTRRRAVVLLLVVALIGGLVATGLHLQADAIRAWIGGDAAAAAGQRALNRVHVLLAGIGLLAELPLLGLAVFCWRLAVRVQGAGRYPPPDQAVVRDTPVASGAAAQRIVRLLRAVTVFSLAMAVLLGWILWRLAALFGA